MDKHKDIYADYAASASANPGSIHHLGVRAKKDLEDARGVVASVLEARSNEIIFTSGGTEANNLAIQGVVFALRGKKLNKLPHIITTNIEHSSVLETCRLLEARGLAELSIVAVDSKGLIDEKKIKKEIKDNTVLVSVMYANNEIGTIEPIKEIAKLIKHHRKTHKTQLPYFHTDAVQAVNYLSLEVTRLGVDLLTLSGNKIIGGLGVGVLWRRGGIPLVNIFGGGDQEMGIRPGTENLKSIKEFAKAIKKARNDYDQEAKRIDNLKKYFIKKIIKLDEGIILNGEIENSLPHIINISIPKIPSELLVLELSARGVYVSEKSACKSSSGESSHVIKAIRDIRGNEESLRFSFGSETKKEDIGHIIVCLKTILKKLREWYY